MRSRPSPEAVAGIVGLMIFTVWITWRAKAIEFSAHGQSALSGRIGKMAPGFTLESLDGRMISLSDYHGKPVVLVFWASWCGPCRLEMPLLSKFYQESHKEAPDFEVLAVSIDVEKGSAKSAAESLNLPFTVLLDPDGRLADIYGVDSIPALFVVDNKGKVTYSHAGFGLGLDVILGQQLGIKGYMPSPGAKQ